MRRSVVEALMMTAAMVLSPTAHAQEWARHEFFANSGSVRAHFYSSGNTTEPSTLELIDGKLPVETKEFHSGPNSLRLSWQSRPNGGWDVELDLPPWANRTPDFDGDALFLWLRSDAAMPAAAMPRICLRDASNGFSERVNLGEFSGDLAAGQWKRVRVPLVRFVSASVRPFDAHRTNAIVLLQGAPDTGRHTLYIDDVRFDHTTPASAKPPMPVGLTARGYERHVLLTWNFPAQMKDVSEFVIYRSQHGGAFHEVTTQRPDTPRAVDYLGDNAGDVAYRITTRLADGRESAPSSVVHATTHAMTDDELLTLVQEASFSYYWDAAEPNSGMARESIPGNPDMVAVGSSGFGVMALIVGAERGFAPRDAIVDRMLRITNFLAHADRWHGAWPHFLSGSTGKILPTFGLYDDGADIVETSFMMEGLLAARGYFNRDTPKERRLRDNITGLWRAVEWDWFNATPAHDALYWHWSPDFGFHKRNRLAGWNETLMPYLLGIASPTHPIPPSLYYSGWAAEGEPSRHFGVPSTREGIRLTVADPHGDTGPLFFTHYSFMGYDPRGVRDKYADYFDNNRNLSLVQQKYAIENPGHYAGYGADSWGMTASNGPHGYRAFHPPTTDDGTLAPTAAVSAYAYVPQASLAAIKHFYRDVGAPLWDVYGFRDSFNATDDWYSSSELGLDQAPQVVMIENGRTGLVWRSFMSNPEMPAMQKKIGLVPVEEK